MQIRWLLVFATGLVCLSQAGARTLADNWPQFRGATGNSISSETDLPVKWSADRGILWKTGLDGAGNSSPAVTDEHVVVTTKTAGNTLRVLIVDRHSGRTLNNVVVGKGQLKAKGPKNLYAHRHNAATPSPIARDGRVWAFFGTGLLVCLDAQTGKPLWQKDMVDEYGEYDITFGMGSTPRLWKDTLYVSCLTKGASYVVAFDAETGQEKWKTERRLPAEDDGPDAYSTPIVWREQLLISGSDHVNAYDLQTGQQKWITDGLRIDSPYGRVIASPVGTPQGIVIATSGNPGGGGKGRVIAVDAENARGDISDNRVWTRAKSTPDSSTPVSLNGLVFMVSDNGILTCIDVNSGKVHYTKRLAEGPYHASLVAGDGKVYALSTKGTCTVLKADTSGKVLGENRLKGTFYSTPAISDGVIFLRAYEGIVAISE